MGFLDSSMVISMFQFILIFGIFGFVIIILFLVLMMFVMVPEIRTLFKASMFKRYVLFDHSSYGTAELTAVKIDGISLEPTGGTKLRPRKKDDVEQTGRIKWIHCHELSPYPASSTTAFAAERFISEMKKSGLPDSTRLIDALLRCDLDDQKMVGFIKDRIREEKPITDDDGNVLYEEFHDKANDQMIKQPKMEIKLVDVEYQCQLEEKDIEELKKLKAKLETAWLGVDSSGADIFAYSHLRQVVDVGMSGTLTDIVDLKHEFETKGAMKGKGENKNLMIIVVAAFILLMAGAAFLKMIGVV